MLALVAGTALADGGRMEADAWREAAGTRHADHAWLTRAKRAEPTESRRMVPAGRRHQAQQWQRHPLEHRNGSLVPSPAALWLVSGPQPRI